MIRNLFLARPEIIQVLSVLLLFLLSFSLCLMGRTGVSWCLCLGSYCLTSCTYSDDSEFVLGKDLRLSKCFPYCFAFFSHSLYPRRRVRGWDWVWDRGGVR